MNKLNIKKLNKDAILPTRNTSTDAGLDLYAINDIVVPAASAEIKIEKQVGYFGDVAEFEVPVKVGTAKIGTGIAIQIPNGYVGIIESRSGLGFKHGIEGFNGVIDSGYRSELGIKLNNFTDKPYEVKKGDRIAQLVIYPIALLNPVEVDELDQTDRNTGGFGSSGR